ncbi:MAG: hypothetical protein FMNOHCHN_03753 [Ignavibacteriaceae bacterium]|nr:hypothetical protein [Ignavibacteriaceae bacterium]
MKKLKVMRLSGRPVDIDELEAYKEKWRITYDKVIERCKLDMLRVHKLLLRVERIMQKQYKLVQDWDLPTTEDTWSELVNKYGAIMVVKNAETGELVLVINDQEG